MDSRVGSEVRLEIAEIDELLTTFGGMVERAKQGTPTLDDMAGLALVLHSFYNGLENAFLRIAKGLDGRVPDGLQWHRNLLLQMTVPVGDRGPVISEGLCQALEAYLSFRHFARHAYAFHLKWVRLRPLVFTLHDTWSVAKHELTAFLISLPAAAD